MAGNGGGRRATDVYPPEASGGDGTVGGTRSRTTAQTDPQPQSEAVTGLSQLLKYKLIQSADRRKMEAEDEQS